MKSLKQLFEKVSLKDKKLIKAIAIASVVVGVGLGLGMYESNRVIRSVGKPFSDNISAIANYAAGAVKVKNNDFEIDPEEASKRAIYMAEKYYQDSEGTYSNCEIKEVKVNLLDKRTIQLNIVIDLKGKSKLLAGRKSLSFISDKVRVESTGTILSQYTSDTELKEGEICAIPLRESNFLPVKVVGHKNNGVVLEVPEAYVPFLVIMNGYNYDQNTTFHLQQGMPEPFINQEIDELNNLIELTRE